MNYSYYYIVLNFYFTILSKNSKIFFNHYLVTHIDFELLQLDCKTMPCHRAIIASVFKYLPSSVSLLCFTRIRTSATCKEYVYCDGTQCG